MSPTRQRGLRTVALPYEKLPFPRFGTLACASGSDASLPVRAQLIAVLRIGRVLPGGRADTAGDKPDTGIAQAHVDAAAMGRVRLVGVACANPVGLDYEHVTTLQR